MHHHRFHRVRLNDVIKSVHFVEVILRKSVVIIFTAVVLVLVLILALLVLALLVLVLLCVVTVLLLPILVAVGGPISPVGIGVFSH